MLFEFVISFEGVNYLSEVIDLGNGDIIIYVHEKTTPIQEKTVVFTLADNSSMWYNKSIANPNFKAGSKILWLIKHHKIFYQNNEVGNAIHNYFKVSGV